MRHFINLVEAGSVPPTAPQRQQLPISGALPAEALAELLPDVEDVGKFSAALIKIQQGNVAGLAWPETSELANAFISLVKLPDTQKTAVIQKMMPVHEITVAPNPNVTSSPVNTPSHQ